jgi:hypothetical protein
MNDAPFAIQGHLFRQGFRDIDAAEQNQTLVFRIELNGVLDNVGSLFRLLEIVEGISDSN